MSLRCSKCTAAFFSNKLLEKHQSKCMGSGSSSSNLSSKSQFVVNVSFPATNVSVVSPKQVPQAGAEDAVEQLTLGSESPAKETTTTETTTTETTTTAQEVVAAASSSSSDVENVSPKPLTAAAASVSSSSSFLPTSSTTAAAASSTSPTTTPTTAAKRLRVDIPIRSPGSVRNRVACNACGKIFNGDRCKLWLIDHVKVEHLEQPPHQCPKCPQQFVYLDTMQEHAMLPHSTGVVAAASASSAVAASSSVVASADLPDVVEDDDNAESNARALDANSRQRSDSSSQSQLGCSYCCGLCNETYPDVPSLLKHFAERHPEFSTDELTLPDTQQQQQQQQSTMYFPYVCTLCTQAFDQLSAGRDHLRERHPSEWRQICSCPVCDIDCGDETGVAAHVSEIHADPKVGAGSGVFACRANGGGGGQCRPCSSPEQLRLHYLSEHVKTIGTYIVEGLRAVSAEELPDTVYECGACRDRFADREKLEMHFATGCPALETMETDESVGQQQQQQQQGFQHQAEQQQQPEPMEAGELNGHRASAQSTVVTSADSLLQQSQPPDAAGASVTVASA